MPGARRSAWPARLIAAALIAALLPAPAGAKDSLGVFEGWGAFRDPELPRCYAIAQPEQRRKLGGYASIGYWPRRRIRGQLHIRLSRAVKPDSPIGLSIGARRFVLIGRGRNAWARDRRVDAAVIAALRSGSRMAVSATGENGRAIRDSYTLAGAATAMDAAALGCARLR